MAQTKAGTTDHSSNESSLTVTAAGVTSKLQSVTGYFILIQNKYHLMLEASEGTNTRNQTKLDLSASSSTPFKPGKYSLKSGGSSDADAHYNYLKDKANPISSLSDISGTLTITAIEKEGNNSLLSGSFEFKGENTAGDKAVPPVTVKGSFSKIRFVATTLQEMLEKENAKGKN